MVSDIAQDHYGFIWLATGHGVARFDGHRFDVYDKAPRQPGALPRELVDRLTIAPDGIVWAVTEGGISRYRVDRDAFETFTSGQLLRDAGTSADVITTALLVDRDKRLWLGTSEGLFTVDTVQWRARRVTGNPRGADGKAPAIAVLSQDTVGTIWAGTRQGLYRLSSGGDWRPVTDLGRVAVGLPHPWVRDIVVDRRGMLWLATQAGVVIVDSVAGTRRLLTEGAGALALSNARVSRLFADRNGRGMWIGTENGGLEFFDTRRQRVEHHQQDPRNASSLRSNSVWALLQDTTGTLWVGTFSGGLSVAPPNGSAIRGYSSVAADPSSLSYDAVPAFGADARGSIWVATDGGGLNRFEPSTGQFARVNSTTLGTPVNAVLSVAHQRDGTMWLGTWGGGVVATNVATGVKRVYDSRTAALSTNNVYEVLIARNGAVWAGTDDGRVIRLDASRPRILQSFDINPDGSRVSSVLVLRELADGRLVSALRSGGVVILNPETGAKVHLRAASRGTGIESDAVRALHISADTVLWVGTESGLDRVDLRTLRRSHIGLEEGLPSRFVLGIVEDEFGALWLTSDRGLTRWDARAGQARTFTREDGLTANEFIMRSAYRAPDGQLYFGGNHGFTVVDPSQLPPPRSRHHVVFTHLTLFDKPVEPGATESPIRQWLPAVNEIRLRPNQKMVSIAFSALNFEAAARTIYEYRLSGFQDAWLRVGNRSSVSFSNLVPGAYTLQVRAMSDDGKFAGDPSNLTIRVQPPVSQTWWARTIVGLLLAVFGWRLWAFQQRRQVEQVLAKQALRDPLTGLANRLLFEERVSSAIARAARTNASGGARRTLAVMFLDLDNFKTVNDTHGHDAGDDLLKVVATRLLDATRGIDTVARFAGDEFAILLEEAADHEAALIVASRIGNALAKPIPVGPVDHPHQAHVGSSIGITFGDGSQPVAELMRQADLAMYEAKHGGKGRHMIFDPVLRAAAEETRDLERSMPVALAHGEFLLLFQPIVEINSERLLGAEALLRWRHPERGWVAPDRFIPIAEGNGEIVRIGAWVLREACRAAAQWPRTADGPAPTISVNISGRQLAHPELVSHVREALDQSSLQPSQLLLEVTETVMMKDSKRALSVLRELHALGVRIAVDDFGTGYSSLRYLQQFPVDVLKIDRSFVERVVENEHDQAITAMVVALANSLGLRTIAEGVETEAQRRQLTALGACWGQGYLFDRPMPAQQMAERLAVRPALSGV